MNSSHLGEFYLEKGMAPLAFQMFRVKGKTTVTRLKTKKNWSSKVRT